MFWEKKWDIRELCCVWRTGTIFGDLWQTRSLEGEEINCGFFFLEHESKHKYVPIFQHINECLPDLVTQGRSLLHVAHQVLDVPGDGFGVKQRGVHPSLAALEDDVRLLHSACTAAQNMRFVDVTTELR